LVLIFRQDDGGGLVALDDMHGAALEPLFNGRHASAFECCHSKNIVHGRHFQY